jgi:hypothetical protein
MDGRSERRGKSGESGSGRRLSVLRESMFRAGIEMRIGSRSVGIRDDACAQEVRM